MNMEAMSILNPSEESMMEKKFEAFADNAFSESTPARQLAFNNSTSSDYKVYDSNLKDGDIFNKLGIQMFEGNESENNSSIHQTPTQVAQTQNIYQHEEKEIKPERNAYTEIETASETKQQIASSGVKISKPGDDIVINNNKIESKDSMWKPAPVMRQDPVIVNNVSGPSNYKSMNLSFNENTLPKPTLGMPSNVGLTANQTFVSNLQGVGRTQNNNEDLIETLTPQPMSHPGGYQPHYQSISQVNEKMQSVPEFKTVKENMSSNIIDSFPPTSPAQTKTTSTAGTAIREGRMYQMYKIR